MKVNEKNRQICRPQEYIKLANSLFNLSRRLKELSPCSVVLEANVSNDMVDLSCDGRPPFWAGSAPSGDLKIDNTFAESLGLDLHNYLKSR